MWTRDPVAPCVVCSHTEILSIVNGNNTGYQQATQYVSTKARTGTDCKTIHCDNTALHFLKLHVLKGLTTLMILPNLTWSCAFFWCCTKLAELPWNLKGLWCSTQWHEMFQNSQSGSSKVNTVFKLDSFTYFSPYPCPIISCIIKGCYTAFKIK